MSTTVPTHGHLFAVSVGPVQGFINTARRTRDLWFGSSVLSEIAKAVARSLREHGGELVFPAFDGSGGDEPAEALRPGSKFRVGNKLLAVLPAGTADGDTARVAEHCREAAQARWLDFAAEAHEQAAALGLRVREDLWQEQVGDVIEVYCAWVPLAGEGDYSRAYRRLESILSGRKLTRDFRPGLGHAGIPKSTLDGARESVIEPRSLPDHVLRRAGVKRGEQLDAVGLVKRLGGGSRPFPPVCRMAAQPWLAALREHRPDVLRELCECFRQLADQGYVSRCSLRSPGDPFADKDRHDFFPFEAEPLFAGRRADLEREVLADGGDPSPLRRISALVGRHEPSPYLAVLVGDGDRMGATLSLLGSAQAHQDFSRTLAEFACKAQTIVEEHGGCLVYSGGDDVLALLPVDTALAAAETLRNCFADAVGRGLSGVRVAQVPTFSVGIGVGHFQEPLGELLERARQAEKHAKGGSTWAGDGGPEPAVGEAGRDALAVWVQARAGGEPVRFWSRWADVSLVHKWVEAFLAGRIPARTPYELRRLAVEYGLRSFSLDESLQCVLTADLERVLRRREPSTGGALPEEVIQGLVELCRRPGGVDRAAAGLRLAWTVVEVRRAAMRLCEKATVQRGTSGRED
ncbi:MAG: type III-B CRISPR-associated protein Cas10/Cmr2 [Firmicutes bacterium]|nr:type III-B CRISPR-associated protein Cas10/Cmr2 [Bacillota bacterium]